jgi:NADPH:quinone reductase-like Zn-dependent oxidoreductase
MLNRRMVVSRYGGPEVFQVLEEPLRPVERGELRIKVESAGVALGDVMRREGVYPGSPTPPFTPGYDVVGIVDEAGEEVRRYAKGDRVGALTQGTGGYSEYVYAKEEAVFPVAGTLDAAEAVAIVLNYVTAYQMLYRFAQVTEGNKILIHGASGGVGTALLELGSLAGLTMFGTASSAKHGIVSAYGATPIDYRTDDFVKVLAEAAPEGMDAVFDPIGGENWRRSFQTLSCDGRFIGYGFTSALGERESDEWANAWRRLAETKKTDNGRPPSLYSITSLYQQRPEWFREDVKTLFTMLETGKIRPIVSHRIPLREAGHAQRLLDKSSSIGKVVLIANGEE